MNLWHNSLIRVRNSPICYKTWATKGVREVRHLIKDENSSLSLPEFRERFNIKINYLIFHGIIAAIRPQRKLILLPLDFFMPVSQINLRITNSPV